MAGLDEFYEYLERPEKGRKRRTEPLPPPGPEPGVRYVVRNGLTIAVPVEELPAPAKTPPRAPRAVNGKTGSIPAIEAPTIPPLPPARPATDAEGAALWERVPRHIQILSTLRVPDQMPGVRTFEETREQLIRRLLDPTLTLEETARLLDVCPATVRRYTNRGQLPHHRTIGQQRRFRLSDVLTFLERRAARASEDP